MSSTVRLVLIVLVLFAVTSAVLAPAPRRRPPSEWRWALRWLLPAALLWAGIAHLLDAPTVSRILLVGFVVLACLEIWLLRYRGPADDGGATDWRRLAERAMFWRRRGRGSGAPRDRSAGSRPRPSAGEGG